MKFRTYLRLFLLVLIASISLILFSYSRSSTSESHPDKEECGGKCENKKNAQSEFILWESLSRNLLSVNH